MKTKLVPVLALSLVLALPLLGPLPVAAQDPSADQQKMMELWKEYSTPGKHHETLAKLVGEWDYESKVVMPGMESVNKGTTSCRWVIPKLWVGCESLGTFMGQPHTSFNLTGFDNFKKNFILAWVDSTSTALNTASGVVVDPTGKVEVAYGSLDEFLTGEHDKPLRVVRRWLSDDKYTIDVWDLGIGETGQVVLRFTYTRKKEKE